MLVVKTGNPYDMVMYITPTKSKTMVVEKAMRQKGVRANPDVACVLRIPLTDWLFAVEFAAIH